MTGLAQSIGIVVCGSKAINSFKDVFKFGNKRSDYANSDSPEHQEIAKDYGNAACYALYTSVGMSIICAVACYGAYKSATKKN